MPPRGKIDPDGLHPVGGSAREALLVDLLAVDAAREPVQHAGPQLERADDPVADAVVVTGQVELGLAPGREVDTVGVGDPYRPSPHGELDGLSAVVSRSHRRRVFGTYRKGLNTNEDAQTWFARGFGARARMHGNVGLLRVNRRGRGDRDDPTGAGAGDQLSRHGPALWADDQRGAGRPRDRGATQRPRCYRPAGSSGSGSCPTRRSDAAFSRAASIRPTSLTRTTSVATGRGSPVRTCGPTSGWPRRSRRSPSRRGSPRRSWRSRGCWRRARIWSRSPAPSDASTWRRTRGRSTSS